LCYGFNSFSRTVKAPLTYRIAGTGPTGSLVLHLVATNSTAAYWISKELWPDLQITSVTLLDEWSDVAAVDAKRVAA
jgi:hypothetical protein